MIQMRDDGYVGGVTEDERSSFLFLRALLPTSFPPLTRQDCPAPETGGDDLARP